MGQVRVGIGGRTYPLSCGDGEEGRITALAALLAAKADELTAAIGTMSEPRLLLMAGIQVADELFAARNGGATAPVAPAAGAADDERYAALLARVETLAATLEAGRD
ncbi:cell division protein ZapA [Polymorphobacter sp. PAMC 29334]|uniref:cell division protein ZapA n=1 Tax=Polymorphobacter sp. PAMC 29334 TaxID=2862331 RepID=UPI001C68262D|nr:cell division protein ZapA [Polymorphobacter sp. PAMC 29334]QYE34000.1 cell division protein ZapA [Polymorphobacter sp. PAMC 29334]